MSENLMDIIQLAEYLQMNKMTVYKLARQGKIPAFKVASEWRFRKDLIDRWLMSQLKGKHEFKGFEAEARLEGGKTVLVVDDEEIIRDFFKRTLTEYRVLAAASGEEALDIVKEERPDLVLLDIKMPGIDGIETLRRIKKIDAGIAVVMLSAFGTLETNLEAARLGAYTSIAKPFDLKDMQSAMKSALLNSAPPKEIPLPPVKPKKRRKKKS
jgi:two-component system response regulator (stage 0 sporulation protein F)